MKPSVQLYKPHVIPIPLLLGDVQYYHYRESSPMGMKVVISDLEWLLAPARLTALTINSCSVHCSALGTRYKCEVMGTLTITTPPPTLLDV